MRIAILGMMLVAGCSALGGADGPVFRDTDVTMTTEPQVDIDRYLGTWYEIARFPNRFEEGCAGVTATYGRGDDDRLSVINTCLEGGLDGPLRSAEGVARAVDATNAKLRVRFAPIPLPFAEGDYWILDVDADYRVAVVGAPDGQTGWILARDPRIDTPALESGFAVLRRNGYDVSRMILTPQP